MRYPITTMLVAGAFLGWHAASRPAQAPAPPHPADDWRTPQPSAGTLTLERGTLGHFFVHGDILGKPVYFLVDTGASAVSLNRKDAEAAGIDMAKLVYDGRAETAAGSAVPFARVTLPALRVGDIQLLDVPAAILATDEGLPLLGQSFLGRIDKVSIEGDRMTLTKL